VAHGPHAPADAVDATPAPRLDIGARLRAQWS